VEEFLSQNGIPYELRDQFVDPVTRDELAALFTDAAGRQLGPLTRLGQERSHAYGYNVVYGCDLLRIDERVQRDPAAARAAGATVWGRPDEQSTRLVLDYLSQQVVPTTFVDVLRQPLAPDELWDLLYIPQQGIIRSPFTVVDGQVVLGFDLEWLRRALGEQGERGRDVPLARLRALGLAGRAMGAAADGSGVV
jgi:arsenate reductase-like glutaredoxin family protein